MCLSIRRPPTRGVGGPLALTALVLAAFSYSLTSLGRGLRLDTPLAYLGLVPLLSVALMVARLRSASGPPIHDRQIDWIVGLPLIAVALLVSVKLPGQMSIHFWEERIDLVALPFFVAGAIALTFGTRAMWQLRGPIAFLFLAWPGLWTRWTSDAIEWTASTTRAAVRATVAPLGLATHLPSGDGSLFRIGGEGPDSFVVSVSSACSGASTMLGFVLTGAAFLGFVSGRRSRKMAWLLTGTLAVWTLNLARLLAIFWAGRRYGKVTAIQILHPYLGMATFTIALLTMVLLMRPFGLSLQPRPPTRVVASLGKPAVPRRWPAFVVVGLCAAVLSVNNAQLDRFTSIAGELGAAKLLPFASRQTPLDGYRLTKIATYEWATPYFGKDSTWQRFGYHSTAGERGVTVDVINASDASRFDAYGLKECYQFHKYRIFGDSAPDIGMGIRAQAMSIDIPNSNTPWNIVAWVWPVLDSSGGSKRYERIVLLSPGDGETIGSLVDFARTLVRSHGQLASGVAG